METFQAIRTVSPYSREIHATPHQIFPFLCPVKEYNWIDGWTCRMIYSDSGVAEDNCVFTRASPLGMGEEIWVGIRYEPEHFIVQYLLICPEAYVRRMDLSLKDSGDQTTTLCCTLTLTGLSDKGNALIRHFAGETLEVALEKLFGALEHFCVTGNMLKDTQPV
jgi:hypothetical protein